ncbi:hypothetical protein L2750_13960 [Shewanella submarina]|uniref:Core-binding (CB) domain-containing protein n=1 Tax=Shewanella submarina TaxID=2016376 RepID=A0ABV7GHR7_9GAMM|nr:hypothetical protein [Shewanella submarina]MCL1038249.1 hypothetical protein [Shewanella submarina]
MGRKRNNPMDAQLPPRVYRGRASFEWNPKAGSSIRLCPVDAPLSEVWRRYEEVSDALIDRETVAHLVKSFMESKDFAALAPETRKDYVKYSKPILQVFGKMHVDKVKPQHVRLYMDKRGTKSPIQANR